MISVIIPVYNERETILEIIRRVRAEATPKEIVVVDDGSTDGTRDLLAGLSGDDVRVLLQPRNRGKGAAIRAGLAMARGDIVVVQDADLELNPDDYAALLAPLQAGTAEVVYGARFLLPQNREGYRLVSWLGNTLVTGWTNLLFGARLTDEATGYKVMRTALLRSLNLACDGFDFCAEVTAKLLLRGITIHEVPVRFNPRTYVEGKKIGWRDGIITLWVLLKFRCTGA
mgnify:CR=1 FL=1